MSKKQRLFTSIVLASILVFLFCQGLVAASDEDLMSLNVTLRAEWKDCDGDCDATQTGNHVSSGSYTVNISGTVAPSGGGGELVNYEPRNLTAHCTVQSKSFDIVDKDCQRCNPVEKFEGNQTSTFGKDPNAIATIQAFMGTLGAGYALQLTGELGPGYERTLPKLKGRRIIALVATAPFTMTRSSIEDCNGCKKTTERIDSAFGIDINADMAGKKSGSATWTSTKHPLDGPGASVIDIGGEQKLGPERDMRGRARYTLTWSLGEVRSAELTIKEVRFNYDGNKNANVPLFSHNTDREITAPEWTAHGDRKPAAFVRNVPFKVMAVLGVEGKRIEKAEIWAEEEVEDQGSSFKRGFEGLKKELVSFKKGETRKEVELTVKRPQNVIGVNRVRWSWRANVWYHGAKEPEETEIKTGVQQGSDFTEHTIYIVGGRPVKEKNAYEFAVKKGCQWAEGETGGERAFKAIWDKFWDIECPEGSGCVMRYEHKHSAETDVELMRTGKGKCGAWTDFFMDVVGSQGIAVERFTVKAKKSMGLSTMVVRPGPAQGNRQPARNFTNHALVKYSGKFYDPSYHTVVPASPVEELHLYENESFSGYCSREDETACLEKCGAEATEDSFAECLISRCECRRNNPLECEVERAI